MPRALRIGLTGGLACGKSTVVTVLREAGAGIVDADELARAALAPGSAALQGLDELLGATVVGPDGAVDRRRIAAIIFADPARRAALEGLVHPIVQRRQRDEIGRLEAAGCEVVVVDVPLLFEVGRAGDFDRVVVVTCRPEQQLERALARGMDPADAERRLAAQWSLADKAERADDIIDNSGTRAATRERARSLYGEWLALARDPARAPQRDEDAR